MRLFKYQNQMLETLQRALPMVLAYALGSSRATIAKIAKRAKTAA
jgi:hypothetical protein